MKPEAAFVFSTDANMLVPLGVVVSGLARHMTTACRVVVLHSEVSEEDIGWLRREVEGDIRLEAIRVDHDGVTGVALPSHLTAATLNRLLIGDLLPGDLTRVVYIDSDVLIRRDPSPLLSIDVEGIGAIRDAYHPWFAGRPRLPWHDFKISPVTPVFNAGVMVVDMPWWRRESVGEQALDLLRRMRLPNVDQDALNLVLAGRWTSLDMRWNLQTDHFDEDSPSWVANRIEEQSAAISDPWFVHFTGAEKPWRPLGTIPSEPNGRTRFPRRSEPIGFLRRSRSRRALSPRCAGSSGMPWLADDLAVRPRSE